METSFTGLLQTGEVGVLCHILSFLDAPALLRCEETSRSLRDVVSNDKMWRFCPNDFRDDPRMAIDPTKTIRMGACVTYCAHSLYHNRNASALAFVDGDLTVDAWKRNLNGLMNSGAFVDGPHFFSLRGDTLGALLEMLQDVVTRDLVCSGELSLYRNTEERYPELTKLDVIEFDSAAYRNVVKFDIPAHGSLGSVRIDRLVAARTFTYDLDESGANPLLAQEADILVRNMLRHPSGTKVIRRLAYRAGIVKLEHGVYEHTWRKIIYMMVNLLRPACINLAHDEQNFGTSFHDKKYLPAGVTMDMVPPFSYPFDNGDRILYYHTLVPSQILTAARTPQQLPFTKVYGDIWLPSRGRTVEEEVANARERYEEGEDEEQLKFWLPILDGELDEGWEVGDPILDGELDEGWEVEMEEAEESQVLEMWEEELQSENADEEMEDDMDIDALSHHLEEQVGLISLVGLD